MSDVSIPILQMKKWKLSNIAQLVRGKAKIQTQIVWLLSLCSSLQLHIAYAYYSYFQFPMVNIVIQK